MKKLPIALLLTMSITGTAIAAGSNTTRDNLSQSPTMNQPQQHRSSEDMPIADWQSKQWDKNKWNNMTPMEQKQYREKHRDYWNKMTPEEKESMRQKHKGSKNYMDDNWDQPTSVHNPQNVGGENKGTPK